MTAGTTSPRYAARRTAATGNARAAGAGPGKARGMGEPVISMEGLAKRYPMGEETVHALENVDFAVQKGEFVAIVGPSGSGKSTLMNIIGLLDMPDDGTYWLNGLNVADLADNALADLRNRTIGFVFQSFNLLDSLTALENVRLPLSYRGTRLREADALARRYLEKVGLGGREGHLPHQLSGGQQQRVAIARAIVSEPRLLLLDEPLSNLDAKLRVDMRSELKRLHHDTGSTIIYVTHDQVEALTMSTKIALFREGELVQVDKPLELYDNPCDLYTADFIGNPSINFVEASGTAGASGLSVDGVMGRLEFSREDMTPEAPASGDLKLVLGIRPEQITISREKTDAAQVEARVYAGMPAGSETLVSVRVGEKLITVKELGSTHYAGDETVYLSYPPKKVNVFDASTKRLIKYSR